jgi:hypothetical protein
MNADDTALIAEERQRVRGLIRQALIKERLPLTALYLWLNFKTVVRLAVESRKAPAPKREESPFVYTLR